VLYLGAAPIYADVNPETLTLDPRRVEALIGARTRALVIQNTFGLSADVAHFAALGRRHGIATIDDCAHGFGGRFEGRPNGTLTDFAFFSSQWNKAFSTGLGGILVSNRPDLDAALAAVDGALEPPGARETALLRTLVELRSRLLTDGMTWAATLLFRRLTRMGLVVGSSAPGETESLQVPPGYFKAYPEALAQVGLRALARLPAVLERRRRAGGVLGDAMRGLRKWHLPQSAAPNNAFLKFPLLVSDRPLFMKRAAQAGVAVSDWFCSPLHPVAAGFERWQLDLGTVPVARDRAARLLCLNTDAADTDRVARFVHANRELIE
jgi:dTDP-4-amino-4,6-dideoxygalactose transaminase